MTVVTFDTLAFSKRLRTQFTPEQAEALAEAFLAGVNEQLATKADLKELESRLATRFAELEGKMDTRFAELEGKMDTRFAELEGKMDTRFAELEGKMDTRFAEFERKIAESANRMILWTSGAMFSSAALVIAVLKLTG